MITRHARVAGVAVVFAALACGISDPEDLTRGMSVESARDLASAAVIVNQHASAALTPGSLSASQGDPVGLSSLYPSTCFAMSGGAETDADGDDVPDQLSYEIDCVTQIDGRDFRITGSVSIDDNDDDDPASGYSVDFDVSGDDEDEATFDVDMSFDTTADGAEYDLSFDVSSSYSDANSSSDLSYDFDQSYSPVDPDDPFAAGDVDFSGSLSFSSDTEAGPSESHDLSVSTTRVLSHEESCGGFSFNDGVVTYADDAGNTLEVIYNGCAPPTVTFNGSPLSL